MSRKKLPYMPRVLIRRDLSTRTILSKRDKASSRRALNKSVNAMWR